MNEYINCFPGYEKVIEYNKKGEKIVHNMYRGTDLGLGGYVYFDPCIYENVALVDLTNAHGASIIALNKFGKNTKKFADIREANIAIKHKDFEKLRTLMDGKLVKYIDDPNTNWKAIRNALKLVCNSSFGISAAGFDNPLRDSRDDNDIIALRGALFMRTLQDEVVNQGFEVAHIKTDSIKIPNATPEIIQFCMDFAKKYSYEFEFEAVYSKLCLINGSTYVAKHMSTEECQKRFGYIPTENKEAEESKKLWTATAAQFQQPYVFKTLFSHEPIIFKDMCETKSSKTAIYLDFNEGLPDVSDLESAVSKMVKANRNINALNCELKSTKGASDRDAAEIEKELNTLQRAKDRAELYLQNRLGTDKKDEELIAAARKETEKGHKRHFIGGVGLFTPIRDGYGGGLLVTQVDNNTYNSVIGTKGYRWMESEIVRMTEKESYINEDYYRVLVDEAIEEIKEQCERHTERYNHYIDLDWFLS